jgi:hypothetical protein
MATKTCFILLPVRIKNLKWKYIKFGKISNKFLTQPPNPPPPFHYMIRSSQWTFFIGYRKWKCQLVSTVKMFIYLWYSLLLLFNLSIWPEMMTCWVLIKKKMQICMVPNQMSKKSAKFNWFFFSPFEKSKFLKKKNVWMRIYFDVLIKEKVSFF